MKNRPFLYGSRFQGRFSTIFYGLPNFHARQMEDGTFHEHAESVLILKIGQEEPLFFFG